MTVGGLRLGRTPRTAGVIVEGRIAEAARRAVAAGADLLELRGDTFRDADEGRLTDAIERLRAFGRPVILTIRSRKEGGKYAIPERKREALFTSLMPLADAVDIELGSSTILENVVNSAKRHKKKVIVSYHNFKTTPGDRRLQEIAANARASGGDIVKIAAFARGPEDLKRLAGILTGSTDMIVIAMGGHGAASRVFFPFLGSLLTYGAVSASTAPGQMPLKDLCKEIRRYQVPRGPGGQKG
ncbi:MAG: type I 3-dehydroquinate dehydratase [Thermodesulfobacteriota bacterium]